MEFGAHDNKQGAFLRGSPIAVIFVDPRKGSGELAEVFRSYGVEVLDDTELAAADFAFSGNGAADMITLGIERKEVGDMLNSLRTRRLSAFQIPNILDYYDRGYLLIEGAFRPDPKGPHIQLLRKDGWSTPSWLRSKIGYDELVGYLDSIEQSGVSVLRTYGPNETVRLTLAIYRRWQKPWEDHKVFQQFQAPAPPGLVDLRALDPSNKKIPIEERRRIMVRLMTKELPGIGWKRSAAVAERFGTMRQAMAAAPHAWQELEGIGPEIAGESVQLLGQRLKVSGFSGKHKFLSNFYPSGNTTVEHLYQSAKAVNSDDAGTILLQRTPAKARKMGRAVAIREDWDQERLSVMRRLLDEKFTDPKLREMLLATGDSELIEVNTWGDTFWGVCDGRGKNRLGKMLMEIREGARG